MQEQPDKNDYLIFELTEKWYGVDARLVREIVRLPEITPMEDAPVFILGVMNVRGRVVPVLDLNCRLGRLPQEHYRLADSVVVLEQSGRLLGLLVNDVREVTALDETDMERMPSFEEFEPRRYRFIQCVAKLGEALVMLLAPQHLLHVYPLEVAEGGEEHGVEGGEVLTARRRFNPEGGAAEQTVFRERARRLMQVPEQQILQNLISLAVVRLHDALLGVDLTMVAGFAKVRHVTPIPCCPEHIAGSMNLRGDVLTLVDISRILGLSVKVSGIVERAEGRGGGGKVAEVDKVVIVPMGRFEVGVLVQDVVDIIHLQKTKMAAAPTAASALRKEHLQGAIPYGKKMLGVLDVQAILADPALLVNEEV